MAAHCRPACSVCLMMLVSIVAPINLEENSSSKYTAELNEEDNPTPLSFGEVCDQVPYDILKCSKKQGISVLSCNCFTYDSTQQLIEVGKCSYNFKDTEIYTMMKTLGELCEEFNREGTLCGNCIDGHYPLAYSYDMSCVECPDGKSNWWKYMLAAFLPLTAFCFIVLLFKINITSSYLQGFVFYSQCMSVPLLIRPAMQIVMNRQYIIEWLARVLVAFYGIWNLDFLRSMKLGICLGTNTLQTLALELAVGVYPLLLMVLSYLLIDLYDRNYRPLMYIWKPVRAIFGLFPRRWDVRTSLIHAFAAFLVLSSTKLLCSSLEILAPVDVYLLNNSTGNLSYSWRVYYNASLPYFGEEHLPYAVLAIAVLLLFVLLPALLLILYPFRWFQKFLNLFPVRWYVLHTFMDSFQGCYKDGIQPGSRDYRWFASAFFILRISLIILGIFTFNTMLFPLTSLLLGIYIIALLTLEPFKENHQNATYAMFLCSYAIIVVSFTVSANSQEKLYLCMTALVAVLPLFYFTLHWMWWYRKFGLQLIRRLCAWKHGYETLE